MKLTNRLALAGAAVLVIAKIALGDDPSDPEEWNSSYETHPQNTDLVNIGDDWMRQDKLETRRRMEVEHQIGSGAGPASDKGDNGAHRLGSARVFINSSEPTTLVDSSELHDNTSPGAGSGTLSAEETNAANPGGGNGHTVGHGRMWVDTDNYGVYVYDDVDAAASTNYGFKELYAPRGHGPNYLYNGDFSREGLQGLSPAAASCVDTSSFDAGADNCISDPTVTENDASAANGYCDTGCARIGAPLGWTETGTPTDYTLGQITDESADVEQAFGVGGYLLEVSSAGNDNDGLTQTLTGLQENTEYMVVVQGFSDGTNACTVDVTGEASTNLPISITAADTSPSIVVGWFKTDALATNVVLQLRSTSDATYDCHWANAGVYAVRPNNDQIRRNWIYQYVNETTDANDGGGEGDTLGPTRALVFGGSNCVLKHHVSFGSSGVGGQEADLMFSVNGGAQTNLVESIVSSNSNNNSTVSFSFIVDEPQMDAVTATAPGDRVSFQINDAGAGGNFFDCEIADATRSGCRWVIEQTCF